MSVDSEMEKLQLNLTNSYAAVSNKSGVLPQAKNFDNLSAAINTIVDGTKVEADVSLEIDEINGESI